MFTVMGTNKKGKAIFLHAYLNRWLEAKDRVDDLSICTACVEILAWGKGSDGKYFQRWKRDAASAWRLENEVMSGFEYTYYRDAEGRIIRTTSAPVSA